MSTSGEARSAIAAAEPPRAGRKEWTGLGVIALPCLLYAMDLTVLYLAVPSLTRDLEPSGAQLLWITDIYGFLLAGFLIPMGTLGDRIGRRRLLLIGAGAFGLLSVLAAFSTSAAMLIVARALLGIAGATLAPSTLSLIRNMFLDPRDRTFAIGVWIASFSAGAAIGPLIGGVLLEWFWWGSVFLIGVPVMVLLLAVGPSLLPEFRDPGAGRIDLISAAMSLVAVLTVIYGLKRIAEGGAGWTPALWILVGVAVAIVFLRRQLVSTDPLIDLRLFLRPAFSVSLATYTLGIFVAFGTSLFIAQYLQLVLGMSPFKAGLWTLPEGVGFIVGSMLTPQLVRRVRAPFVVASGLVLAAIGFAVLTRVDANEGLAAIVTGSILFAVGLASVFTLATDLVVGTAPPERAGSASALSETGAEFGGALGIAILGSIGTAVYRTRLTEDLPPGVPPGAAEAAQDTLGGALLEAARLPVRIGDELVESAQIAFTAGTRLVAVIAAATSLGIAALVVATLRRVRTPEDETS
jgi:DHA2 family multidrug resistance protein-like MFS transporter